jgi:hypothetical protein
MLLITLALHPIFPKWAGLATALQYRQWSEELMKTTRTSAINLAATTNRLRTLLAAAMVLLSVSYGAAAAEPLHVPTMPAVGRTAVQLRIGGVPSDSIICFETRLNSVVAKAADGTTTKLVSSPLTVEVMHWAGDSETVAVTSLRRGRYTEITIAASGARMTYLNTATGLLVTRQLSASYNTTIQFNPALVVGRTPIALNLQITPANIVNTLGMGNNGIRNAGEMFRVSATRLNTLGLQKPENGGVDRIVGSVTNVSSASISLMNGQTGSGLTFRIDRNTRFYNAGVSTLQGLIVAVRGRSAADGSLVATDVEALENHTGAVVEGVASGYVANSNLVTLASQDGSGDGMKSSIVGSGVSVDPTNNPNFEVDTNDVDMTGLESLQFDANSLVLGQRVQVQSMRKVQPDSNGNAGLVIPETVKLEPQTLTGTVANYELGSTPGTATFDLVFATDASMNVLNPFFSTMHVFQQPGTDLSATISNGATVRVWGLVFHSPLPQGSAQASIKSTRRSKVSLIGTRSNEPTFIMVAARITHK